MANARNLPPDEILAWMAESFDVFPDTGTMIWKATPKGKKHLLGKQAGSPTVPVRGKSYMRLRRSRVSMHRGWLIFLWVHRHWPTDCLDHRDGNSLNDAIDNLREATVTQNAWNHKDHARRMDLPMGVYLARSGRFQAEISCHKKRLYLGTFNTPDDARAVYLVKRKELFGEFA